MKNKKAAIQIGIIVVIVIILGIIFNWFGTGSIIGTFGTKEINFISEYSESLQYQVISTARNGVFTVDDGELRGLGLGETSAGDSPKRYDELQIKKQDISNVKFYGPSGEEIPSENVKGYCRPETSSPIQYDVKQDIRIQDLTCEITSGQLLSGYENGISKITLDVIILKTGVICVEGQDVNCASDETCMNNQCVKKATTSQDFADKLLYQPVSENLTDSTSNDGFFASINNFFSNLMSTIKGWFS